MWQPFDCSVTNADAANPGGCRSDLYPWVEVTVGAGTNGQPQPADFNDETTGEGATSMAYYNMQQADVPYFKRLADHYTISNNDHQAGMRGTGLNHVVGHFGDDIWFSDGPGNAATPPTNEIENPNPAPGTNNWYTQDGYSGGSYTECSDASQPGVGRVVGYLQALPAAVKPNCDPGHCYLLNN